MEKYANSVKDRFRIALIPALLLGILTNAYISVIIIYADFPLLLISPIVGTVIFISAYLWLKKSIITPRAVFSIGAITVGLEVVIHTYFFGWDAGFYFYLFLLPLVFLLESNWKFWGIILFTFLIFGVTIGLSLGMRYISKTSLLQDFEITVVSYLNGILTGAVAVVIIIYSSKMLSKRDQLLMISINN